MNGESISLVWQDNPSDTPTWATTAEVLPRDFSEVYKSDLTGLVLWRTMTIGQTIKQIVPNLGELPPHQAIPLSSFVWAMIRAFLGVRLEVRVFDHAVTERILARVETREGRPFLSTLTLRELALEIDGLWPTVDCLVQAKILQPETEEGIHWFYNRPVLLFQTVPTRHIRSFLDQGKPEFQPAERPKGLPLSWSNATKIECLRLGKPKDLLSAQLCGRAGLHLSVADSCIEASAFGDLLETHLPYYNLMRFDHQREAQSLSARQLGRVMYETRLVECRNEIEAAELEEDHWIRMTLSFSDRDEEACRAARLPWEWLHDGHNFLLTAGRFTLVRRINLPFTVRTRYSPFPRPVRIAVISGNTEQLRPDTTVLETLESQFADLQLVHFRPESLHALKQALGTGGFHIIHLAGHGSADVHHNGMPLGTSGQVAVPPEDWADLLGSLAPQLVVIASCATHAPGRRTLGGRSGDMATALLNKGISNVLAFQSELKDDTWQEMLMPFYRYVFAGFPFDIALAHARQATTCLVSDPLGWAGPVLYLQKDESDRLALRVGDGEDTAFLRPN